MRCLGEWRWVHNLVALAQIVSRTWRGSFTWIINWSAVIALVALVLAPSASGATRYWLRLTKIKLSAVHTWDQTSRQLPVPPACPACKGYPGSTETERSVRRTTVAVPAGIKNVLFHEAFRGNREIGVLATRALRYTSTQNDSYRKEYTDGRVEQSACSGTSTYPPPEAEIIHARLFGRGGRALVKIDMPDMRGAHETSPRGCLLESLALERQGEFEFFIPRSGLRARLLRIPIRLSKESSFTAPDGLREAKERVEWQGSITAVRAARCPPKPREYCWRPLGA
jgi:hypothetical protein